MSNGQQQQHGPHGNPLIGEASADTIGKIYSQVEFLCLVVDSDPEITHPGLAQSLRMVLGGLDSLKGKI